MLNKKYFFIHSKTSKNDGFRPNILGVKKYTFWRYTFSKLPTSLFSTKGDAEHICDLDHPHLSLVLNHEVNNGARIVTKDSWTQCRNKSCSGDDAGGQKFLPLPFVPTPSLPGASNLATTFFRSKG